MITSPRRTEAAGLFYIYIIGVRAREGYGYGFLGGAVSGPAITLNDHIVQSRRLCAAGKVGR